MTVCWICKTTSNSEYYKKIDYLSEPSIDLIGKFKKDIVHYEDPTKHKAYVVCDHIEKIKGHMLFVLDGRVEVLVRPDKENKKLFFVNCDDI